MPVDKIGALFGGPDGNARRIIISHRCGGLQIAGNDPARFKTVFAYQIRLAKALFHIAEIHVEIPTDIVLDMIVDLGRAVLHGFFRIKHPREHFIFHIN